MTNKLRAKKIKALAMVSCWVDDESLHQGFDSVVLSWAHPKLRQFATINVKTGKITRFVLQVGKGIREGKPEDHTAKVDRRIRYLVEKFRAKMVNRAERLRQSRERYQGRFTDSELLIK